MNKGRVEILLIEDNPADVELTLNALKKKNLAKQRESSYRWRRGARLPL